MAEADWLSMYAATMRRAQAFESELLGVLSIKRRYDDAAGAIKDLEETLRVDLRRTASPLLTAVLGGSPPIIRFGPELEEFLRAAIAVRNFLAHAYFRRRGSQVERATASWFTRLLRRRRADSQLIDELEVMGAILDFGAAFLHQVCKTLEEQRPDLPDRGAGRAEVEHYLEKEAEVQRARSLLVKLRPMLEALGQ